VTVPDVPTCVTVDPAGTFLYVATATFLSSDTLFAYAIDASSGNLTRVAGPALDPAFDGAAANFRPACVTFVPTGRLAYVADRSPRTGASSRGFWAFPAQASGRLGPSNTGPFTTPGGDPVGFAVDPSGRFAYAIDGRGAAVSAFTIDAVSGALAPIGSPLPVGSFPVGLVVVP
jgi:6-phosphogluconolactonase (cycloisomerase 2 family)